MEKEKQSGGEDAWADTHRKHGPVGLRPEVDQEAGVERHAVLSVDVHCSWPGCPGWWWWMGMTRCFLQRSVFFLQACSSGERLPDCGCPTFVWFLKMFCAHAALWVIVYYDIMLPAAQFFFFRLPVTVSNCQIRAAPFFLLNVFVRNMRVLV